MKLHIEPKCRCLLPECMAGSNQCVDGAAPPPSTSVPTEFTSTQTTDTTSGTMGTTSAPDSTTTSTCEIPSTTTTPGEENWRNTVVYMKIETQPGQDSFLRGGITERQGDLYKLHQTSLRIALLLSYLIIFSI